MSIYNATNTVAYNAQGVSIALDKQAYHDIDVKSLPPPLVCPQKSSAPSRCLPAPAPPSFSQDFSTEQLDTSQISFLPSSSSPHLSYGSFGPSPQPPDPKSIFETAVSPSTPAYSSQTSVSNSLPSQSYSPRNSSQSSHLPPHQYSTPSQSSSPLPSSSPPPSPTLSQFPSPQISSPPIFSRFYQTNPSINSNGPTKRRISVLGIQRISSNCDPIQKDTKGKSKEIDPTNANPQNQPNLELRNQITNTDTSRQTTNTNTSQKTTNTDTSRQTTNTDTSQKTTNTNTSRQTTNSQSSHQSANKNLRRRTTSFFKLQRKSSNSIGSELKRQNTTNEIDKEKPPLPRYSTTLAELQRQSTNNAPGLHRHLTCDNLVAQKISRKSTNTINTRCLSFACKGESGDHVFSDVSENAVYHFGTNGDSIWLTDIWDQRVATGKLRGKIIELTLLSPIAGYRRGRFKRHSVSGIRKIEIENQTYCFVPKENGLVWINRDSGEAVMAFQNSTTNFFPSCPEIVEKAIALLHAYECYRYDHTKKKSKNIFQ